MGKTSIPLRPFSISSCPIVPQLCFLKKQLQMTTFNIPTREEVSPASQTAFDNLKKGLGMVPNLYAAIAWSENGLPKYLAYQGSKTSLSNKEKEAVNLTVSQVNGCKYCLSAHTVLGRMNGFTDEEILLLRKGGSGDSRLNALVTLAKDITENKGRASLENLDAFFAAGYTKGSLVDLILQVSDKIAMNYLHNLTGITIDFPLAPDLG
jgi:AhpD family alkylhydroperoxidase